MCLQDRDDWLFDSGKVVVNLLTQNSSSRDFAQEKNFENRATDRLIIIIKQLLPSSKIREIEEMIADSFTLDPS